VQADRLTSWLALLALALGALVVWQSRQAPQPPPTRAAQETPVPAVADSALAADVSPPPLMELTETVERPLFAVARRPEQEPVEPTSKPEAEKVATPTPPPALRLSAVIIEPDRRQALLIPRDGGAAVRVPQGGEVQGWTLNEVREDAVVLIRGASRHELELRTFEPPPQPARRVPAARAGDGSAGGSEAPRVVRPGSRSRRPLGAPRRRPSENPQTRAGGR
jgi:hypothetical protein